MPKKYSINLYFIKEINIIKIEIINFLFKIKFIKINILNG